MHPLLYLGDWNGDEFDWGHIYVLGVWSMRDIMSDMINVSYSHMGTGTLLVTWCDGKYQEVKEKKNLHGDLTDYRLCFTFITAVPGDGKNSALTITTTKKERFLFANLRYYSTQLEWSKKKRERETSNTFICATNAHLINPGPVWILIENLSGGIWKELRGLTAKWGIPQSRPEEIWYFRIITVSFIR